MAQTLGRIAAVQDDHTQRLDRVESCLGRVESEVQGLRNYMPSIVADAMREVLKEK